MSGVSPAFGREASGRSSPDEVGRDRLGQAAGLGHHLCERRAERDLVHARPARRRRLSVTSTGACAEPGRRRSERATRCGRASRRSGRASGRRAARAQTDTAASSTASLARRRARSGQRSLPRRRSPVGGDAARGRRLRPAGARARRSRQRARAPAIETAMIAERRADRFGGEVAPSRTRCGATRRSERSFLLSGSPSTPLPTTIGPAALSGDRRQLGGGREAAAAAPSEPCVVEELDQSCGARKRPVERRGVRSRVGARPTPGEQAGGAGWNRGTGGGGRHPLSPASGVAAEMCAVARARGRVEDQRDREVQPVAVRVMHGGRDEVSLEAGHGAVIDGAGRGRNEGNATRGETDPARDWLAVKVDPQCAARAPCELLARMSTVLVPPSSGAGRSSRPRSWRTSGDGTATVVRTRAIERGCDARRAAGSECRRARPSRFFAGPVCVPDDERDRH